MWRLLRENFPRTHFRRQVPIRHYIADFASHRSKLVIEIDGGHHSEEVDAKRTAIIEGEGYRIVRFWNNEVLGNPDGVLTTIARALLADHPSPTPPHREEGL
jgi:very-short-patch-repair endonuclease